MVMHQQLLKLEEMKRYIHMMTAVAAFMCVAACTEKLGTDPGNDPGPKAVIYQYDPGAGYNADEDVAVRFVSNGKAEKMYYYVELLTDKDAFIAEHGEDEYAKRVISEGVEIPSEELAAYDDTLTAMPGTYAITAVAVSGSKAVLSESLFHGLLWTTISKGTYEFAVLSKMGMQPAQTEFQVCDTDETLFRFKDLYKPGYSLKIQALPGLTNTDDYGTYTFCRVPVQDTGLSYGDLGAIGVRDIGYWQGDESFITEGGYESCYYTEGPDEGCLYVFVQYYVSAVNLGYEYDTYTPEEQELKSFDT